MSLQPTRPAAKAADYRNPGGPWHDLPALDLLADGPALVDGTATVDATTTAARATPATTSTTSTTRLSAEAASARTGVLAAGLLEAGVRSGDVVTWRMPNQPAAVLLYRACWRIGAIVAPVHHRAGAAEIDAALGQVGPALYLDGVEDADRIAATGQSSPVPRGAIDVDPSAVAVVQFTVGSTGRPKAVIHTHQTLGYKARSMAQVHGLGPADAVLMPAPMAHVSGLLNGVLVPAVAGMTVVTMAAWDPGRALALIKSERVSFMVGPQTFFIGMRDDPGFDPAQVVSLRLLSCGGAGVTPAFVETTAAAFDCMVKRTYGLTEAPTVTTTYEGDPVGRARDTDGRATGPVELRISDGGELWLRGPEVCQGYASDDDTRSRFTDDGWLRTGDLASLDEGWLTITGRLSDVIIRGGENIPAGEVEAVLEAHPDVHQAVAVAYPDDRLGERVCAFVVVTPGVPFGLEESRAWFEARGVTRFKWPERVEVVQDLPLLPAGKPDRARLRDLAASSR